MSFQNEKVHGSQSPEAYHTPQNVPRGTAEFVMTSTALREFLFCPGRWKAGFDSSGSKSTRWGTLLDERLLQRITHPVRPATYLDSKEKVKTFTKLSKTCKAWLEEHPGSIDQSEAANLLEAIRRLSNDDTVARWLDSSENQILVTAEWKDEKSGLTIPVKCLIDFVPRIGTEFEKSLGDLKTARCAHPSLFSKDIYKMGYHIQAAFYTDMYCAATHEDRPNWCFILSENVSPWQPGREILSVDYIDLGRKSYRMALQAYARCVATDTWPGYDDHEDSVQGWSIARPSPWMEYESLSSALQFAQAAELAETEPEVEDVVP